MRMRLSSNTNYTFEWIWIAANWKIYPFSISILGALNVFLLLTFKFSSHSIVHHLFCHCVWFDSLHSCIHFILQLIFFHKSRSRSLTFLFKCKTNDQGVIDTIANHNFSILDQRLQTQKYNELTIFIPIHTLNHIIATSSTATTVAIKTTRLKRHLHSEPLTCFIPYFASSAWPLSIFIASFEALTRYLFHGFSFGSCFVLLRSTSKTANTRIQLLVLAWI